MRHDLTAALDENVSKPPLWGLTEIIPGAPNLSAAKHGEKCEETALCQGRFRHICKNLNCNTHYQSLWHDSSVRRSRCSHVTFGQIKSQEAGETHHRHTGVEVRRRVTEELARIWRTEWRSSQVFREILNLMFKHIKTQTGCHTRFH